MPELTPMMRQYVRIKEEHPDAILFFRLGDFYEMFRTDAQEASRILGLTLTSRQGVPMCGVPHHSATRYIARLIEEGRRVAICEQVSLPDGKGLADRQVVEVITPGTVTREDYLPDSNNFIVSIARDSSGSYLAFLDVSTGEMGLSNLSRESGWASLRRELARLEPREALVQHSLLADDELARILDSANPVRTEYQDWEYDLAAARTALTTTLGVSNLKSFGIDEQSHLPLPAGVLLTYVRETTRAPLRHILALTVSHQETNVGLDENTIRNLELVANMHDGSTRYTLLETLRDTRTTMGARMLRRWILSPLSDRSSIVSRQEEVARLKGDQALLTAVRRELSGILDLERLTARLSQGRAHAKDLVAIRSTISASERIRAEFDGIKTSGLSFLQEYAGERSQRLSELADLLDSALVDEPATVLSEGRVIRSGFDPDLDRLRTLHEGSRQVLEEYVESERERTGITTLRVRQNRVLGHFLELGKSAASRVPSDFVRRQSLASTERFSTERLTEIETEIAEASERIVELEREIFLSVRSRAESRIEELLTLARAIAELDSIQSLAEVASRRAYVRPEIVEAPVLEIRAGRHPVVEANLPAGEFVPNETELGERGESLALITGPNMAGKSTYLRQSALIVLMAQLGSFVPADGARVGIADRIFCRVGASDNLARGESTFLVEMNEAAYILRTSSPKSIVIMDEIGRGTSTNDGLAIARAILEHLSSGARPRTLFATHFHELTALNLPVRNLSMAVAEHGREIVFLKRVQEGPSNNSYGIHVATLAGVPRSVTTRAAEILETLVDEKERRPAGTDRVRESASTQAPLFAPFELIEAELREIDVDQLKPIDALARIARWQEEIRGSE